MDNHGEIQKGEGNPELTQIVERVRSHTESEGESGITFIKDLDSNKPEVKAANLLYDGLMLTLQDVAEDSLERVDKGSSKSSSYEQVLRSVEPISFAAAALADDKIPLRRATNAEERLKEEGDNVRVYTAGDFKLDDVPFDFMSVFIRPKTYIRPSNVRPKQNPNRPQMRHLVETKQPRMALRIVPRDSSIGVLEIRLDQEDVEHGMQISYDIVIGEDDILKDLRFSSESGQREGHHFNTGFTSKELGVSFEQILNSLGDKVDRSIAERDAA